CGQVVVATGTLWRWMHIAPVQVDDALHRAHQKSLNPVVVFGDDDEGGGQVFQRPATGSPPQINDRQRSATNVRHAADNGVELGQQRQSRTLQHFLDLEHIDAVQLPPIQAKQQQLESVLSYQLGALIHRGHYASHETT